MPPSAGPPDRPSAVVLGIDAGGSHTTVLVADADLRELARTHGPGAAMRPGGAHTSAAVIADTARRAVGQARLALPARAAMVGAAGAGRSPEREELEAAVVAAGVAERVRVAGDAEVALAAAFGEGPGILINAGTGSVAFARDPAGGVHRSGGYGWQLGDEGGGYWLGRSALNAASRAQDGRGESTTLLERLIVALGLQRFDDLIRWTATATPAQIAALAPHVLNAAREGEAVAQRVVSEAAGELVALVAALDRHFPGAGAVTVATTGGLLPPGSPLLDAFRESLHAAMPRARFVDGPVDAPLGAVQLARALL